MSYSKLARYDEAYVTFRREVAANPGDLTARLNLVTLFADTGRFVEAEAAANEAAAIFPDRPEVLVVRGASCMLLGQMEAAEKDFAQAVKLSPNNAPAVFLLALSEFKQARYEVASRTLDMAMQSGITDSDLYYLLAECLLKLHPDKRQDATEALDRALQLNQSSVPARILRGKILLESDRSTEAVVDLKMAHEADPRSRSATYNLARAYAATGQLALAKSLYQEMNGKGPDVISETGAQRVKQALGVEP